MSGVPVKEMSLTVSKISYNRNYDKLGPLLILLSLGSLRRVPSECHQEHRRATALRRVSPRGPLRNQLIAPYTSGCPTASAPFPLSAIFFCVPARPLVLPCAGRIGAPVGSAIHGRPWLPSPLLVLMNRIGLQLYIRPIDASMLAGLDGIGGLTPDYPGGL